MNWFEIIENISFDEVSSLPPKILSKTENK